MKKKILLVEDSASTQKLLYFILSKEYDVFVTSNGYEAFLWLDQTKYIPDLIIMDWIMPYMDGRAFLKCIKVSGLYSEIPVIVLSSSKDVKEEVKVMSYTISKTISKPFNPLELMESISEIFNIRYGIIN